MLKIKKFSKISTDTTTFLPLLLPTSMVICSLFLVAMLFFNFQKTDRFQFETISLAGDWKFSLEDNPDFSKYSYDDSSWKTLSLPGNFINSLRAINGKNSGIFWVRKSFQLNTKQPVTGINLGKIANADQTYFNGIKIGQTGSFPPDEFAAWNHPRFYLVPENTPPVKTNSIAVRIHYNFFGDIKGDPTASLFKRKTELQRWYNFVNKERFINITMGYITIAVGVALIVFFSLVYYQRPLFQENLYYCLQLYAGFPIVLEVCNYWNIYHSHVIRLKILGFSWVFLNVVHPIFLHRIYEFQRKKIEMVLWGYLFFILLAILFFVNEDNILFWGIILTFFTWSIGLYNLSCHISALHKKSPYAKLFSFFGITVILCALNDGALYFQKLTGYTAPFIIQDKMIFHIGAIFLFFGTALVIVAKHLKFYDKIEELNINLENFIVENTVLTNALSEKTQPRWLSNISHESKEKIEGLIEHIHSNFLQDLSRNDLAESIGLHPDNLGTLFKKITGVKLRDYIYKLRIEEAAKRLVESDDKIIDIAFETGFESLRTFNRAFPKFMQTTPGEYRKNNQSLDP